MRPSKQPIGPTDHLTRTKNVFADLLELQGAITEEPPHPSDSDPILTRLDLIAGAALETIAFLEDDARKVARGELWLRRIGLDDLILEPRGGDPR